MRGRSLTIALLAYLWSAPLALVLSSALNWQYDGGLGWWIAALYAAPLLIVMEFIGATGSDWTMVTVYLISVALVSAAAAYKLCSPYRA